MATRIPTWLFMLCVLMLPACVPTNPFTTKRVIGQIPTDRVPELEVLRAPARASVNQPFTVTVITHSSSSCTTSAGAQVEVTHLTATITPLDLKEEGPCTADLAVHPREVELTFQQAGEATMRVIGQNFDGEPTTTEQLITITPP